MIVMLKPQTPQREMDELISFLKSFGVDVHVSRGTTHTILGLVGDTSKVDRDRLAALEMVEDVKRIQEPFKSANRKFHPDDTVVEVGDKKIKVGGGHFAVMAGPCSVESKEQITFVAQRVQMCIRDRRIRAYFEYQVLPYFKIAAQAAHSTPNFYLLPPN